MGGAPVGGTLASGAAGGAADELAAVVAALSSTAATARKKSSTRTGSGAPGDARAGGGLPFCLSREAARYRRDISPSSASEAPRAWAASTAAR